MREGPVDLLAGDLVFLDEAVGQHRDGSAHDRLTLDRWPFLDRPPLASLGPLRPVRVRPGVERVEDPVLDVVEADPQLGNPVAEEVRFGPAKVVPQLPQAFDPNEALESCLGGQTAEPIEDRDGSVVVAVENDFGPGHRPKLPTSSQVEYPQICETSQGVRFRGILSVISVLLTFDFFAGRADCKDGQFRLRCGRAGISVVRGVRVAVALRCPTPRFSGVS